MPRSTTPIIHRIIENANGRDFERELVRADHFIKDGFIDLTALKMFMAGWVRDEARKAVGESSE